MFLKQALKSINIVVTILAILSASFCFYIFFNKSYAFFFDEFETLVYFFFSLAIFIFSLLFKWLVVTIIKNS